MTQYRRKGFFAISIICVLMYTFLFSTVVVFADEPIPPANTTEVTTTPSVSENLNESTPETECDEGNEEVETSDTDITAPTSSQDEQANTVDESDVVEVFPSSADEVPTEPEPLNEEPVESPDANLDTDSDAIINPDPATSETVEYL